jgi:hypothetical protein
MVDTSRKKETYITWTIPVQFDESDVYKILARINA